MHQLRTGISSGSEAAYQDMAPEVLDAKVGLAGPLAFWESLIASAFPHYFD